jgi:hypothetical protein
MTEAAPVPKLLANLLGQNNLRPFRADGIRVGYLATPAPLRLVITPNRGKG